MSKSVFISTVSAKQMAREAEISSSIVAELRQLLEAERERGDRLEAKLSKVVARAKTRDRRQRRRAAKVQAELEKAHAKYDEVSYDLGRVVSENTTLKYGQTGKSREELEREVESERYRSDRIWDDYNETYSAWQTMRAECDTLLARCEEREAEIAELRERNSMLHEKLQREQEHIESLEASAQRSGQRPERSAQEIAPFLPHEEVVKHLRALGYKDSFLRCTPLDLEWKTMLAQKLTFHTRLLRGFPASDEAAQEEAYIRGASEDQLRQLMQHITRGEMLPENEDRSEEDVKEVSWLNWIRRADPERMTQDPELMRRFLLQWRWYTKRLPGGFRVSDLD